jgi:predicted transcriptional regulator
MFQRLNFLQAEQKAEIERLTEEKWQVQDDLDNYNEMNRELETKNTELQKQVDELKKRLVDEFEVFKVEAYGKVKLQAVKDTAKEILQYVGDLYDDGDQRFGLKSYQWHKNLCKRYGVEVE